MLLQHTAVVGDSSDPKGNLPLGLPVGDSFSEFQWESASASMPVGIVGSLNPCNMQDSQAKSLKKSVDSSTLFRETSRKKPPPMVQHHHMGSCESYFSNICQIKFHYKTIGSTLASFQDLYNLLPRPLLPRPLLFWSSSTTSTDG